ncbi:MAG: tRNA uridine(34) 5-carboxymethylaminomethyl modification radical SAM/GNAT enzyme Elp3 [Candidatus Micrarchaeota archaeon]|nr:tRNA uridine(34) 5-carboxymethylaminomethyl modification radical SAM/GNAT enzyme Elp3 [Candidatus Micrarchaeota archaeon]
MLPAEFIREVEKLLRQGLSVEQAKKQASIKYRLSRVPKNSEILPHLSEDLQEKLFRKPTRTLSGVAPVAVMVRPQGSCRWRCRYCPISSIAPKSYTGYEPSALRARSVNYDPYEQVKARLLHYKIQHHRAQKLDIIIMGGTFLEMDPAYKQWFVKRIYDAVNEWDAPSLPEALTYNERAERRVVGLTIETRPDVYNIPEMLSYGATKVELGVQHPDDKIYELVDRGHTVEDVIKATRELKNAGYKILYHIMLGLPGSNPKKDLEMIKSLFEDERFRPDMLKIYPTLVVPGAPLYEDYKKGLYTPYSDEEAAQIIAQAFEYIPHYVRIQRINRDIPGHKIEAGVKKSNIREIAQRLAQEKGITPQEIRANEAARKGLLSFNPEETEMFEMSYKASGGEEYFLSVEKEDKSVLYGFLRLRIPKEWSVEELQDRAIIREIHVYGPEAPIGQKGLIQHRGIGKRLIKRAEEIAQEKGLDMAVISGVGVREYYRKLGYHKGHFYMLKDF